MGSDFLVQGVFCPSPPLLKWHVCPNGILVQVTCLSKEEIVPSEINPLKKFTMEQSDKATKIKEWTNSLSTLVNLSSEIVFQENFNSE